MGLAPAESPAMSKPSVTPATFGEAEHAGFKDDPSRPPADDDSGHR
jgi:hypothetical protein